MEEKQALLFKGNACQRDSQRRKTHTYEDEYQDLSSEGSDEWWEETHSDSCSCGSYSQSSSCCEWEEEVDENGHLFYVKSNVAEYTESTSSNNLEKANENFSEETGKLKYDKTEHVKRGKLLNWMRRKDSKNFSSKPNKNLISNSGISDSQIKDEKKVKEIIIKISEINKGNTLCEKLLGLSLGCSKQNQLIVTNISRMCPTFRSINIKAGYILHEVNNFRVTSQNIENILKSLIVPCDVSLKIEESNQYTKSRPPVFQSSFIQSLVSKNEALHSYFLTQPVGIVVVDIESQTLNKDDVIYSYPEKCILSSCRGAFITLHHLVAEIKPNELCRSSSILLKAQPTHVLYKAEENFLVLIALPKLRYSLKEATLIINDLIRNLLFSFQTLKRCFETSKKADLDQFFYLFFARILSDGFSLYDSQFVKFATIENVTKLFSETSVSYFEDILPYANWIPLPKEVQIQIDEALNELEANDFENEETITIENQRKFNILGSCLFHKGYLLTSHLSKDDLLDIVSFTRQNSLIQLLRNEPVKSLVIWREVYPLSVNRGLFTKKATNYPIPTGRWFMIIVGHEYDALIVLVEVGESCLKVKGSLGPSILYIKEAEDTLKHIQKLGISRLASQWIENDSRFKTVILDEVFFKKGNKKRETLLGFVKTFDGSPKHSVPKESLINLKSVDSFVNVGKKVRVHQDTLEDSASQTASNVSEISDENVPILGRRGERGKPAGDNVSGDSDSSDSDWDSSRNSNTKESSSSGTMDNFYLSDLGEVLPMRLTTGPDDLLLYYVHLDGNEGVLINPSNSKRSTPKMKEILQNFRRSAQKIHSTLENNIRFKKNSQDNSICFINKSLVAVKEHGVIFECISSEFDSNKKPITLTYWIVGRLYFTPQPREVYVCYLEDAPQNLVEIAFRLGLSAAG